MVIFTLMLVLLSVNFIYLMMNRTIVGAVNCRSVCIYIYLLLSDLILLKVIVSAFVFLFVSSLVYMLTDVEFIVDVEFHVSTEYDKS